ncbi:MAG TPA: ribonuclease D [Chloroflexi bacterium]|nr:ribonuclease D [Chloroflexota bacterium]
MSKQHRKMSRVPKPIMVKSTEALEALLTILDGEPTFAIDTESNSLYAYQEQICLIQISIPQADYLVDPLADVDVSLLGPIFADPGVQKVFHAAEYDVMCFKRDFDFRFENLFDTMWAARILGWPRVGLGNILQETFDVRTNKRYQRYNWGKRPLEPDARAYACLDTHYLLPLRDLQLEALIRKGRWEEAQEAFRQIAASEPMWEDFSPDDFWHVKGAHDLSPREQAILRELCIWRDRQARRQDRPHFKIVGDHTLTALAHAHPRTLDEVGDIKGIKSYHVRRYGRHILQAVERGERAEIPSPPERPPRRPMTDIERYEALRAWRKEVAEERGVDVSVIMTNDVLWSLVDEEPDTLDELEGLEGLGPWKCKTYGEDILDVLEENGDT